ncbi:MAG: hypothetical protein OXF23_04775 [Candidatus Dadabacteria bacterium]|nr:hypothetical protein [Candidatus Dadabacteria bacterium]
MKKYTELPFLENLTLADAMLIVASKIAPACWYIFRVNEEFVRPQWDIETYKYFMKPRVKVFEYHRVMCEDALSIEDLNANDWKVCFIWYLDKYLKELISSQ